MVKVVLSNFSVKKETFKKNILGSHVISIEDYFFSTPREENIFEINQEEIFKGYKGYFVNYYLKDETAFGFMEKGLFYVMEPTLDTENQMISYYESKEKKDKRIKTKSKIGKFFKKVSPFFQDYHIEAIVDYYKELCDTTNDFHIESGYDNLLKIYKEENYATANGSINFKALHASCMRYPFTNLPFHPCVVYDTEDFKAAWVENSKGKVSARCVVCVNSGYFFPIYAVTNAAGSALKEALYELGFKEDKGNSEGARLRIEEHSFNYKIAPYIDEYVGFVEKDGKFYLVEDEDDCDYTCKNTCGYAEEVNTCNCEKCGVRLNSDDAVYVNDDTYCSNCTNFCGFYGEQVVEETYWVYTAPRNYEFWCTSAIESNAVEIDGRYYSTEHDGITFCDYDEEYKLDEEMVEVRCSNGLYSYTETWSLENAEKWAFEIDGDYYSEYALEKLTDPNN